MKQNLSLKKDILISLIEKQVSIHSLADTKAYFIFGVLGFIAWKIIPISLNIVEIFVKTDHLVASILVVISILILIVSYSYTLFYAYKTIFPNTNTLKNNLFYFGYAASQTPEESAEEVSKTNTFEMVKNLSYEYNANSKISLAKFQNTKLAFRGMLVALISFMILYFLSSIMQPEIKKQKTSQVNIGDIGVWVHKDLAMIDSNILFAYLFGSHSNGSADESGDVNIAV